MSEISKKILFFIVAVVGIGSSYAQEHQLSHQKVEKNINVIIPSIQSYIDKCEAGSLKGEFCTCMGGAYRNYKITLDNPDNLPDEQFMHKSLNIQQELSAAKNRCVHFAPFGFDFAIPENTSLAKQVLASHQGEILTPEQSKNLVAINKPVGWVHRFQSQPAVNYMDGTFTYKGKNKDGEEFEYKDGSDVRKYIYGAGILQLWNESYGGYVLPPNSLGKCEFVIGECLFSDGKRLQKVVTKFESGVWIRNSPFNLSRALEKVIYDRSGIPLYKYYQDNRSTTEWIRIDDLNPKN